MGKKKDKKAEKPEPFDGGASERPAARRDRKEVGLTGLVMRVCVKDVDYLNVVRLPNAVLVTDDAGGVIASQSFIPAAGA